MLKIYDLYNIQKQALAFKRLEKWRKLRLCASAMDNYKPSRCYVHCDFNFFLCVRSKFHLSVKGNADCIGSTLQCCVIGPENTRHFLNQSYSKLEPNARLLLALSHALGCLHKLTLSCFVMIGHYTCFGFRSATPNRKGFSNTFDIPCDR